MMIHHRQTLISMQHITRQFGGVRALNGVSLDIIRGEIFGLIGPNGAGKTTLFNVLTGTIAPSDGRVDFDGKAIAGLPPHEILQLGVARTFQNIRLFAGLSALDNVMIGRHSRTYAGVWGAITRNTRTRREEAALRERAELLLEQVGIQRHSNTLASNLSYGDQRRLEIARALASEPKLLALDEPAAGMNPGERQTLRELIVQLRESHGLTILVIEHDVKWMMALCDRIAVLDFGELIALDTPEVVRVNPRVVAAYLGLGNE
jgi:branched-chain amino acid transport system ATP-binding protein